MLNNFITIKQVDTEKKPYKNEAINEEIWIEINYTYRYQITFVFKFYKNERLR